MAIAAKLNLYSSFTPNVTGGFYFPYDDVNKYVDNVLKKHLLTELTEESYRLNKGVAIVNIASNSQIANFKKVTYLAQHFTDTNTDEWIFYHVSKFYFQANKAFFEVTLDNFATYWNQAAFGRGTITRCNRRPVYNGKAFPCEFDYEEWIPSVLASDEYTNIESTELDTADILTIVQIRFVTNADFFGNSPITQTLNFVTTGAPQKNMSAIGTIFAVRVKTGEDASHYEGKAQVVQAWSIPKAFLPEAQTLDPSGLYIPRYKDITDNFAEKNWKGGYGYYPFQQALQHTYEYSLEQVYNYQYFVGTRSAMVSIPRKVSSDTLATKIGIETTLDSAGIKVLMRVGEQTTDITGAFSILVTYNNEISTDAERGIKALQTLSGFMGTAAKTYEKQGSFGLANSAYSTFLKQYNFPNPQPAIGEGEADLTFEYNSTTQKYKFPIIVRKLEIKGNVAQAYVQQGMKTYIPCYTGSYAIGFVNFLKAFDDCKSYYALDGKETYIVADVQVNGTNTEAAKSIHDAFANGLFYCYAEEYDPDE